MKNTDPDVYMLPVKYLEVRHYWNFYDHPIDGVCLIDGKWHYFEWYDHEDTAMVRRMTRLECIKDWCGWFIFYRMVGKHTTLAEGKSGEYAAHKGRLGKALERFYFYIHRRYK